MNAKLCKTIFDVNYDGMQNTVRLRTSRTSKIPWENLLQTYQWCFRHVHNQLNLGQSDLATLPLPKGFLLHPNNQVQNTASNQTSWRIWMLWVVYFNCRNNSVQRHIFRGYNMLQLALTRLLSSQLQLIMNVDQTLSKCAPHSSATVLWIRLQNEIRQWLTQQRNLISLWNDIWHNLITSLKSPIKKFAFLRMANAFMNHVLDALSCERFGATRVHFAVQWNALS